MSSKSVSDKPGSGPPSCPASTHSKRPHNSGRRPGRPPQQRSSSANGSHAARKFDSYQNRPPQVVNWSKYRSILLELQKVPHLASTWDVWKAFAPYGTVVFVELDEDKRGERTGMARVRFEPPPRMNFWPNSRCQLEVKGSKCWAIVESLKPAPNEGAIRSPLRNPVPAKVVIRPSKLSFGIMNQPTTFLGMKGVAPLGPDDNLTLSVDFRRRSLFIFFPILIEDPEKGSFRCQHRLDIKFESLTRIHRIDQGPGKLSVVIAQDSPPRFWRKKADTEKTHGPGRLVWVENDLWARVVEITKSQNVSRSIAASLDNDYHIIDLGRWTTYWFDLDGDAARDWPTIQGSLGDWNIRTRVGNPLQFVPGSRSELWDRLEGPASVPRGETAADLLAYPASISLPFDVRYQLEVCISHGILEEHNISTELLEKLAEMSSGTSTERARARLILEYAADKKKRIFDPMSLFSDKAALAFYPNTSNIPHYCALVRKVTVTPTRIYFSAPTVETTNRVIRHFNQVQDNFLRVQFTDELHEGRINGSDAQRDNEIYTRVFRVLNNGIRMGPWHWEFLAFGNSQIRESGAFFFCKPAGEGAITCDKIRQWMGKFNHIKVVAKYAARLGQCFSTTRLLRSIAAPKVIRIEDVECGKYCFTDGVGKISPVLARMVAGDWELDSSPSAYQFRMGGCKGILVEWPDAVGLEVHIRKSQEKFHSEFNGLEIIRCSHFSTATLNRQTITILSSLGVPDQVFADLLTRQLRGYDEAMTNPATAVQLLTQYVDENQMTLTLARMITNGFIGTMDPFVTTLLQLWRSWSIKALKERARIIVDKGAFVLGCVDETGTLRGYDGKHRRRHEKKVRYLPQIFLQVPDQKNGGDYKVVTGLCAVGRNPSLHPGDIRVVEAVDVPALRHLRDVVVFPKRGSRDVPSMCSGGDLDGDDFFVIWDQKLIPDEWYNAPLDYTAPKPREVKWEPTVQDLKAFFALYMKYNSLPIIAHSHLAQADYMDSGPKDPRCVKLAELHSRAVDYVKTGIEAEMDKKLAPRQWPHFMEKKGKSYHSTKILGQLYDMVHRVDFRPSYDVPFDDRILKKYKLPIEMLKKARRIKSQYDTGLRRVMGQMEVKTEFEIWTSFVLSKPRVGTAYKFHEIVRRESEALKQQFRDICIKESGGSRDFEHLAPFAAAMYQVTWEEVRIALYESRVDHVRPDGTVGKRQIRPHSMPLISFPWLFDAILGRIAMGGITSQNLENYSAPVASKPRPVAPVVDESRDKNSHDVANMDCVYTSDGQIVHRGEILRLFHDDDEDSDFGDGARQEVTDNDESPSQDSPFNVTDTGSISSGVESKDSPHPAGQPDLLTGPSSEDLPYSVQPRLEKGHLEGMDLVDLSEPSPEPPAASEDLGAAEAGSASYNSLVDAAGSARLTVLTGPSGFSLSSDPDDGKLTNTGDYLHGSPDPFLEKGGSSRPKDASKFPFLETIWNATEDSRNQTDGETLMTAAGISPTTLVACGNLDTTPCPPIQVDSRRYSPGAIRQSSDASEETKDIAAPKPNHSAGAITQWDWTELSPRAKTIGSTNRSSDVVSPECTPCPPNTPSNGQQDIGADSGTDSRKTQPSGPMEAQDIACQEKDDDSAPEFVEEELDIPQLSAMDKFRQMLDE